MFKIYGHRLASILQRAIDEFCFQSLPENYDLEIDGLVYIGEIGSHKQAVLKLSRNVRTCNEVENRNSDGSVLEDKRESMLGVIEKDQAFGHFDMSSECEDLSVESHSSTEYIKTRHSGTPDHHGKPLTTSSAVVNIGIDPLECKQRSEADSTNLDDLPLACSSISVPPADLMTTVESENGSSKEESEKVYECCSASWLGFRSYESHYIAKHLRYPCPLCSQSFTSRNNMRRHVNCNHGERRRFECSICEKLFTRPDIVKEHKLTHTKSYKDNRCSLCHFASSKKTTLLMHLKKCLKYENIEQDISDEPLLPIDFSSKFEQINRRC